MGSKIRGNVIERYFELSIGDRVDITGTANSSPIGPLQRGVVSDIIKNHGDLSNPILHIRADSGKIYIAPFKDLLMLFAPYDKHERVLARAKK